MINNSKKVIEYIVQWLKTYIEKTESNGFVIGISGGIDSSLTSVLLAMTEYPVLALELPILDNRKNLLSKKHIDFLTSSFLNVNSLKKDLSSFYTSFLQIIKQKNNQSLALANLKSRIRMMTLYYYANEENYLVVGTGNKIEDFGVGFFTKYGDGGVDIQPIADLNKSDVRIISKELKIIEEIQKAKPTDGLWEDNRLDEDQLKATYDELEWAMKITEEKKIPFEKFKGRKHDIMKIYQFLNKKNNHKMVPIPICKIPNYLKKES
ncbi:NAD(+) synthase [Blattabacterium cuenoti]|uniref:NAD(+) synthase n=1 Tax=Blattabacterium cuenoti TaxID=1653831 RepID=UPI00163B6BF8|nr:NAD(+) synthase [Blattabacterium cuenoti]